MVKCAYCKYSCPTNHIGTYKCESDVDNRIKHCEIALETMIQYNETRSKSGISEIKAALSFTKDVFDIDLQSKTYSDCVRELKEILRIDED